MKLHQQILKALKNIFFLSFAKISAFLHKIFLDPIKILPYNHRYTQAPNGKQNVFSRFLLQSFIVWRDKHIFAIAVYTV